MQPSLPTPHPVAGNFVTPDAGPPVAHPHSTRISQPDLEHFFDPYDFDPIEKFVEYCDHFGFDVLHVLGSVWDMYTAYNSINDDSVVRSCKTGM